MITKNKTFKIIKIKLNLEQKAKAKKIKSVSKKNEIKEEDEEGWVTDEDGEDDGIFFL